MTPDDEMGETIEKTFEYSFPSCTNDEVKFHLEVPIRIPFAASGVREYVQRLLKMFHIPAYEEEDLTTALSEFASTETRRYEHERDEALINKLKNSSSMGEDAVKRWEKLYRQHVTEYAEQKPTSDEEVFAAAYHKLVHSPALETILQVENAYAGTVRQAIDSRKADIEKLTTRQTDEMEVKLRSLNISTTVDEINSLAGRHFEEHSMVAGKWDSQVDALCQTQRTQYRTWLMQILEEQQTNSAVNTPSNSPLGTFPPAAPPAAPPPPAPPSLDESFTIHLGSQLKQTHNIRIVSADALRPCKPGTHDDAWDTSRRLQTSLALYSSDICGLVLLAEAPPSRPARLTGQLAELCRGSTEYHLPHVDRQMRDIVDAVREPVEKRNAQRFKDQVENIYGEPIPKKPAKNMQTGDIFITRHSNLTDVHVIFHMVVDESSLRSGDINSRHLAILGLRNILKIACSNDVTTLSIPLLLRHDMSEEMTVAWCVKRAELVLKCVKGFMMEMSSWGGASLQNMVFVAPEQISHEVFSSLASLLPNIFRLSNTVKLQA